MGTHRIFAALLAWAAPSLLTPATAEPDSVRARATLPQIVAHRAVYDLSLASARSTGAPTSARGRIAVDLTGSDCEGYVENVRQITELGSSEGPPRVSTLSTTTFESGDGKQFRFAVRSNTNGAPPENLDGVAEKAPSVSLRVNLHKPKRLQVDLSGEALFPAEHKRRILAAAQNEEHLLGARVYDASEDGARILETTAVIGRPMTSAVKEEAAKAAALANLRRWPVTISYFHAGAADQQPAYTLSFELYENGVPRNLKFDYGDFALSGELKELAIAPTTKACRPVLSEKRG
jgi:hypothetical protein